MKKRMLRPEGEEEVKETLVNFVLDETASMAVCLDATISGFNEYIQTLRKECGENLVISMSLTKFNSNGIQIVYTNKDVREVSLLDTNSYIPNAMTPLYDAIAKTVEFVDKELVKKNKPKIVCVIMTDGEENASKDHTKFSITELIKEKEKEGWNFVFLGANQDAWLVGQSLGFSSGNIASYTISDVGYSKAFRGLAQDTVAYSHSTDMMTKSFVSSKYNVESTNEKE